MYILNLRTVAYISNILINVWLFQLFILSAWRKFVFWGFCSCQHGVLSFSSKHPSRILKDWYINAVIPIDVLMGPEKDVIQFALNLKISKHVLSKCDKHKFSSHQETAHIARTARILQYEIEIYTKQYNTDCSKWLIGSALQSQYS